MSFPSRRWYLWLLPLSLACTNPENRAAKERIFSPEDPPKVLLAARETLEADRLHESRPLLDRILAISAQEAVARLGPHRQRAEVRFSWKTGKRRTALREERFVALGRDGDFHVRIENDEDQGMEWVRHGGISYVRSRYAPFRERRRDRGASEHILADAYASLADMARVSQGALRLSSPQKAEVAGRNALRYAVDLGSPYRADTADLPPLQLPKDGPDEDTRLRLLAAQESVPRSLSGHLVVDEETGVPLEAKLRGTSSLQVEGEEESTLEWSLELHVENIGRDPGVKVPEHLEDAPRPPGVVATLRAYGLDPRNQNTEKTTEEEREE